MKKMFLSDYKLSKNSISKMPTLQRREQKALYFFLRHKQVGKTRRGLRMVIFAENVYAFSLTNKGQISMIYLYGTKTDAKKAGLLFPF